MEYCPSGAGRSRRLGLRKILNAAKYVLFSVVVLPDGRDRGGFTLRAHRRNNATKAIAIHTQNGIDEGLYVGTGQAADMQESVQMAYRYTLDKARAASNRYAIKELERIGTAL